MAQPPVNTLQTLHTQTDSAGHVKLILGHAPVQAFALQGLQDWYQASYTSYNVDTLKARQLQPLLQGKQVDIFLGNWCGDSRREVPRMMKVLQTAGFDTAQVHLVFVHSKDSLYKQSPQHEERGKNIFRVPTFIVYNGRKEMNRIVEKPVMSLEQDLLDIATGKAYTPQYNGVNLWLQQKHRDKPMSVQQLQNTAEKIKPHVTNAAALNSYGYVLLARKAYTEAINVFTVNVLLYPNVSNCYDSLGEAYYLAGNYAAARTQYEKVLQLQPANDNAKQMLQKMQ
jgi:tetratricopeptide (TPR) repeat protein